jgi:hypothetical protein
MSGLQIQAHFETFYFEKIIMKNFVTITVE